MPGSKEKNVVITGCSSGIGLCLARGFSDRGYRVFATARKDIDVGRLQQQDLEAFKLDLADSSNIESAIQAIAKETSGRIDVLINNGAYGQPGAVEDLSRDALRLQFETNVFGTQELTNRVIPFMRQQHSGRIIQVSSILGLICLRYRGAYNASKYALEALTDTLRLELYGTGIHVSLIEPGPIESRFRENAMAMFEKFIEPSKSPHQAIYSKVLARLRSDAPARFTLPPEAVLRKALHAAEHPRPKIRYPVTVPAHAMAWLKRLLPDRGLDRFVLKLGNE